MSFSTQPSVTQALPTHGTNGGHSGEFPQAEGHRLARVRTHATQRARRNRLFATAALVLALAAAAGSVYAQEAVDCAPFTAAAQAGKQRTQDRITAEEAATKEALDAAKACLKRIDDAMAAMIPGISLNIDFSGLLAGMVNKVCGVVTSKINAQGQVITGTVSGVTTRTIGSINDVIGAPVATGGGGVATVPYAPPTNPLGGSVSTAPAAPAPSTNLTCRALGIAC